jgi:hypothetical protein
MAGHVRPWTARVIEFPERRAAATGARHDAIALAGFLETTARLTVVKPVLAAIAARLQVGASIVALSFVPMVNDLALAKTSP